VYQKIVESRRAIGRFLVGERGGKGRQRKKEHFSFTHVHSGQEGRGENEKTRSEFNGRHDET